MIYRCLCKCPNDHLIEAMIAPFSGKLNQEENVVTATIATFLKAMMELWICDGKLSDQCEICHSSVKTFNFIVDKQEGEADKERITRLWAELSPELMKQRALRHGRKNRN